MNTVIYVFPAGAANPQKPHKEDELYDRVVGRAPMKIRGEDTEQDEETKTGSVIFVAKNVQYHFCQIVEELLMLVFFAPAGSE